MAYQDPYAGQYGGYQQRAQQPQYGQSPYGQQSQQPQYGQYDAAPDFNPYTTAQPHQGYEHGAYDNYGGGYRDDPIAEHDYAPQRQGTQHSYTAPPPPPLASKAMGETSSFDPGEFSPNARGPKTASNLRQYRMEFRGRLWTAGGRGKCFGRFFCCTLMILVFLFVSILLALVLWLRPPSIVFGSVAPMTSGSTIQQTADGININMGVNISVDNPNFFAVNFKRITAEIYYPINNTAIGNGTANSIVLASNAQTNFTFPFSIDYSTTLDPNGKILLDLGQKCGILGTKTNLSVNYKITLGIQIFFVTISPSISNAFSFECPLSANDLAGLLKGVGGTT
ncbi:hypothetical protein B0H15DRAFT_822815 [Mycena belliarum]|uniref:Late embryogenesis abundant protein LEA-2 subgroup domain-containing protein n=1 Tax=Mycena belliarum TaxID=1033014 RepID=A0AAD6UB03_9AGAR|nr:hypothetical protein B0H15DRAFT_822815 [Mycena belliae]